ncbi:hypothetical protein TraAM80_02320 [Trypanosoma rangeli]|uniref:Uncharacterized protein n=1 Tax=Trypanosoma rangeli TaxID=5698 RepID=A0A422NUN3_TRYRA|nr:uncharacterized protein TraAM80_02320 [Trypanosoma rangeli]RNF09175.1 hypothetical protein TraAM80_02320 [Trypanosoma rangeli]|eukprot:RNF09175.1 hypothetical protein TraAM80_02320 [Trypanosoma rangeli]
MFGRRVFASAGLPRHMWTSLHIQNKRQAHRVLPSLALLSSLERGGVMLKSCLTPTTLAQSGVHADVLPSEEGLLAHCIAGMPFLTAVFFNPHNFVSPCLGKNFCALWRVLGTPKHWKVAAQGA